MRVRWYMSVYKGEYDEKLGLPIVAEDMNNPIEGEVIATLPIPEWKQGHALCFYQFVVLLDNGTFTEVPISMCTVVKSEKL